MAMPTENELKDMVVGLAINIYLDIDAKVKAVREACEKYGLDTDEWAEIVTDETGELRGACENQKPIPPFYLADENDDQLEEGFWNFDTAYERAKELFILRIVGKTGDPDYDETCIYINNFASNTCESVSREDFEE